MNGTAPVLSNSEEPTVSVLIAAYNAGTFLHRAVRSALSQTRAPLEIVIINDASTDNTLAVANGFAAEDPRVRVLSLPSNSGPAAARNAGLNVARGDWVAVLDADDAYVPSRLEMLKSACVGAGADIVLDNFFYYDSDRGPPTTTALPVSGSIQPINVYDFVAHARPYAGQTDWGLLKPMFRRAFLDENSLRYPEFSRHGEDFLLMFHALYVGGRCLLVRTPGYLYSHRSSGMSRTKINYGAQIRHTANLLTNPSIRSNLRLSRLLEQRILDLKELSTEYNFRDAKDKKHYIRLAIMAMINFSILNRAAKAFLRMFKRTLT